MLAYPTTVYSNDPLLCANGQRKAAPSFVSAFHATARVTSASTGEQALVYVADRPVSRLSGSFYFEVEVSRVLTPPTDSGDSPGPRRGELDGAMDDNITVAELLRRQRMASGGFASPDSGPHAPGAAVGAAGASLPCVIGLTTDRQALLRAGALPGTCGASVGFFAHQRLLYRGGGGREDSGGGEAYGRRLPATAVGGSDRGRLVLGCLVDFSDGCVRFTVNGALLPPAAYVGFGRSNNPPAFVAPYDERRYPQLQEGALHGGPDGPPLYPVIGLANKPPGVFNLRITFQGPRLLVPGRGLRGAAPAAHDEAVDPASVFLFDFLGHIDRAGRTLVGRHVQEQRAAAQAPDHAEMLGALQRHFAARGMRGVVETLQREDTELRNTSFPAVPAERHSPFASSPSAPQCRSPPAAADGGSHGRLVECLEAAHGHLYGDGPTSDAALAVIEGGLRELPASVRPPVPKTALARDLLRLPVPWGAILTAQRPDVRYAVQLLKHARIAADGPQTAEEHMRFAASCCEAVGRLAGTERPEGSGDDPERLRQQFRVLCTEYGATPSPALLEQAARVVVRAATTTVPAPTLQARARAAGQLIRAAALLRPSPSSAQPARSPTDVTTSADVDRRSGPAVPSVFADAMLNVPSPTGPSSPAVIPPADIPTPTAERCADLLHHCQRQAWLLVVRAVEDLSDDVLAQLAAWSQVEPPGGGSGRPLSLRGLWQQLVCCTCMASPTPRRAALQRAFEAHIQRAAALPPAATGTTMDTLVNTTHSTTHTGSGGPSAKNINGSDDDSDDDDIDGERVTERCLRPEDGAFIVPLAPQFWQSRGASKRPRPVYTVRPLWALGVPGALPAEHPPQLIHAALATSFHAGHR